MSQRLSVDPSSGRITRNLQEDTLINRTLSFITAELPNWRDDPTRQPESAEKKLNAQLCKYLNSVSGEKLRMVRFHHEEQQSGRHSVDVSALPSASAFIGGTFYSVYDPFLIFEGKRLPAPKENPSREREYLKGGEKPSGGVQRFKLGVHGENHRIAALIGYVQEGETSEWFARINEWIRELAKALPKDWNESEQLSDFSEQTVERTARSSSCHPRENGISESIVLCHLWVRMKGAAWKM